MRDRRETRQLGGEPLGGAPLLGLEGVVEAGGMGVDGVEGEA